MNWLRGSVVQLHLCLAVIYTLSYALGVYDRQTARDISRPMQE